MSTDIGSKSIEDLEGAQWPAPQPRTPPTFVKCYQLRKKPLSKLSAADLRTLIGQDIGLHYLVPKALDILGRNPLIETEHFPGDLLVVALRAAPEFFCQRTDLRSKLEKIFALLPIALDTLDHLDHDTTAEALEEATAEFRRGKQV